MNQQNLIMNIAKLLIGHIFVYLLKYSTGTKYKRDFAEFCFDRNKIS